MPILFQPLVPDFAESKLAFHHAKDVLHSSTDSRLFTVKLAIRFRQLPVAAAFPLGQIQCIGCCFQNGTAFSAVGGVTEDKLLVTMRNRPVNPILNSSLQI